MSNDRVAELPVCSPKTRRALQVAIEAEEARPLATVGEVRGAMASLSIGFPTGRITQAEADARMDLYAEALGDLPVEVVEEACRRAVRACRFFPTVAELRDLVAKETNLRSWRLFRMKAIAARHDREWVEPEEPMTAEQKSEVGREMAALLQRLDVSTAEDAPRRSSPSRRASPTSKPRMPTGSDYADFGIDAPTAQRLLNEGSEGLRQTAPMTEEELAWCAEPIGAPEPLSDAA